MCDRHILKIIKGSSMGMIMIGARVESLEVSRAAICSGFRGTDSRASVIRYSLARLAGYSHDEAMAKSLSKPLNAEPGMKVQGHVTAKVDEEILARAEAAKPADISDRATLIRYALALAAEFDPDEALEGCRRFRTGRPRKKDANHA